jgi:hypothetical protein
MQLQYYLEYIQSDYDYEFITYKIYCEALDLIVSNNLSESFFDDIKKSNLSRELVRVFSDLKNNMIQISKDFHIAFSDLITAFKQKDIFNILKAFKFNIKLVFASINEVSKLIRGGLLVVFKELYKTKTLQKIKTGAVKVDDILNKYPILKKVTGIVVAGLLLYIWLNMTFIGDLDYDFNFSDTVAAIHGSFSISDLFVSPEGLMLISLFGSGTLLGLSVPWLGRSVYNLVLAIIYTSYYKLSKNDKKYKEIVDKFKSRIKRERIV